MHRVFEDFSSLSSQRFLCGVPLLDRVTLALRRGLALLVIPASTLVLAGCHSTGLPDLKSDAYANEVQAFYVGLAALQVGDDVRADATLENAFALRPSARAIKL